MGSINMEYDIYKRLELQEIAQDSEKLDLLSAIEKNPYINVVRVCNSKNTRS